jgi:hypothetical protein
MKTKDLIRGYFDNTVDPTQVKTALAKTRGAQPLLRMIEIDQFGRTVLSEFAPEEGAVARLANFITDVDPSALIAPEPARKRPSLARLLPEVVGFQKRTPRPKRKKRKPKKRK